MATITSLGSVDGIGIGSPVSTPMVTMYVIGATGSADLSATIEVTVDGVGWFSPPLLETQSSTAGVLAWRLKDFPVYRMRLNVSAGTGVTTARVITP